MARLLLVALCIACASAFSPPATLAPRTVVARTASVEMGARGKSQAQRGNINLLKKPKAKKAAPKRGKVAASRRSPHCCRRQQLPCCAPQPAEHAGFSPGLHPTVALRRPRRRPSARRSAASSRATSSAAATRRASRRRSTARTARSSYAAATTTRRVAQPTPDGRSPPAPQPPSSLSPPPRPAVPGAVEEQVRHGRAPLDPAL